MLKKMSDQLCKDNVLKLFYSERNCTKEDFYGEIEYFMEGISEEELAKRIINWCPDLVVSISLPDNNAVRDASLSRFFSKNKIPYIMHPLESVMILSNKWDTVRFLRKRGVEVPKTIYVSGDLISKRVNGYGSYLNIIEHKLNSFCFPCIVKPLWDSMSQGIKKFEDLKNLMAFLRSIKVDHIIQEYVSGELLGIEAITYGEDVYFQPLIKKYTDENLMPFAHLRYGPYEELGDEELNTLKNKLKCICLELRLNGSVEFELIYDKKKSRVYILEINPRISGMTNLSSMISKENTYTLLAKRKLPTHKLPYQYAVELPLKKFTAEDEKKVSGINEVRNIQKVVYHTGEVQVKIIATSNNLSKIITAIKKLSTYGLLEANIIKESGKLNEVSKSNRCTYPDVEKN
ncbi:ATP-grasp domain-containing protein [Ligilactobacillus faecis]|uniref:ATP-grasp domain-containing protein n=1 Tax=Ligilactobacillus faecis TaxID=762833 RepID=UPI0024682BCF|nr:ATP-grasp domain-containing protein [Ligilactobacillus faecis]WGN89476.1 ATP-grasp domain-containing protein [Ligilactobacillus faecis]